ncbi:MAG: helix-turn-helix domain-containing protein [bacterium]|nr:helix-turn-helix domain-containing protein [bacterium]
MRNVVLPIESSRASGRDLLRGVAKYSRLNGPWTFYWEPGGLDDIFPHLKSLKADGIIMRDSPLLHEVMRLGVPVIVVGHHLEKIPGMVNIMSDSRTIGRMGAEHLVKCGFHHFAYCGLDDKPWSNERSESFAEYVASCGYKAEIYKQPFFPRMISWGKERKYLVEWLKSLPKPVGLMACHDDRGQQVLHACKVARLKIPDDVAIIGVDNDELVCNLSDPPLSSVAVNFERGGFDGAAVLDRLMNGEKVKQDEILVRPTHIVARQSTDVTAVKDEIVAEAVRYIRQSAKENIGVDDVVSAVTVSRRVLEKRFRDQLDRSILHEIRRVRANLIAQMLVETNLSVSQISLAMGFNGNEHIARYFQREKGMSLSAYRKTYGRR